MMMISAHGRLARDPKPVNTHSGKPMTTATLAVSLDLREDGTTEIIPVVSCKFFKEANNSITDEPFIVIHKSCHSIPVSICF